MAIDTETYYRTYGPMVLRRCRQMLKNEDQALDAMHDVFVQLLRHQDRLQDSAPSSLLFRIATNVCLNSIRSAGRRPETSTSASDDGLLDRIAHTDDPAAQSAARSVLARLFRHEQPSTRSIAVMHLYDGMTLDEVAGEVGMSVSGVRKRLRKLRAQLHELEAI
ncbi:RNA polymerase sigma factor [Haliangium sp.]|uniref:RNA polymerase sigma factor n=1 Tax=Haliangium sp. TaxID=2663208 RepID=UPI003D113E5C